MTKPLFFNQEYFYNNTEVDENTNYSLIQPIIWDCQELNIQDILGTPLYREIKEQIVGGTVTVLNATLIQEYINPCLIKYVMVDSQVSMLYKFRNKAVLTERSDYSTPVEFKEHVYLKDFYQIKAEKYAEKIQRYLEANISDYPLYQTYSTSDEVRAQEQKPTVSVYLGGGKKECKIWRG